ncbi:MAG: hypothetical protein R6W78_00040 [Bacteroidales bacterium]
MKKEIFIMILFFSTSMVFSQINKSDIIISGYGNYNQSTSGSGTYTNQYAVKGKYLDIGASIGYFVKEHFIIGVGLDYMWSKEYSTNSSLINVFYQVESMDYKSNILLPNVFFGYYYQIVNKLYINGNLKLNFGRLKSNYSTTYAGVTDIISDGQWVSESDYGFLFNYAKSYEGNSELDYLSVLFLPELTYFISSRFGLNLGLGGIGYSLTDWELDNSDWIVSFNPSYWKLGFKIRI